MIAELRLTHVPQMYISHDYDLLLTNGPGKTRSRPLDSG